MANDVKCAVLSMQLLENMVEYHSMSLYVLIIHIVFAVVI